MHVCWYERGWHVFVGGVVVVESGACIHILLVSECKLGNCPDRGHKTVSFKP